MSMRSDSVSSDDLSLNPPSPRLASLLRCEVCGNYLAAEVALCGNNHRTCCSTAGPCARCGEPLLPPGKHVAALRRLAETTARLPCRNVAAGCRVGLPALLMRQHEAVCGFKQYPCPLSGSCHWVGRRFQMKEHATRSHPKSLVFVPGVADVCWQISKNGCCSDYVRHLVITMNEIFVYQKMFNYNDRQLCICVQLIGPPDSSAKYEYKIKLSQMNGDHSVSFKHVVHDETADLDVAFAKGDCIKVPYDTISQFSSGSRVVSVKKRASFQFHSVTRTVSLSKPHSTSHFSASRFHHQSN